MPEPDRSRPHPAAAPPDGNPAAVPGADPAAVPDASPAADPAAVLDAVLAAAPRADPAGGAGGTDAGAGAGAGARTARAVWRALGESGLLAGLYPAPDRTGRLGVRPRAGPLRDLLTALEERCSTGVALSVCVQVATALPVLSAALDSPVARRVYEAAVNGEAVVALA
ncbi:MAG TPA: hypothetical protein VFM54_21465, partial [Micromonosporaceae bacterium]|nr:hypothetical protein [Micromonosporaceae bacterium]